MKRIRFPIQVKRGSQIVKIYRDRKEQRTYYRVVFYLGGKRRRLNFSDLGEAQNEAEAKAAQLSRGDLHGLQLSSADYREYGRAKDILKEFDLPLDGLAIQYIEARKLLDGVPLIDAARFYARHHGKGIKRKSVAQAVAEMIEERTARGLSQVYLDDLRYRLGLFADSFHCEVSSLTQEDVQSFFDSIKLGARSFNNFLCALRTFLRFAQDRSWLSKEVDLLGAIKSRKEKQSAVEIFSPQEMARLLEHATPQIAPCLALGAFAGLRTEEILRLEWADVTRRAGFIEVAAHKAKTAARRLVPICDNLAHWLGAPRGANGLVWQSTKHMFYRIRLALSKEAGLKWKKNALRHSFISYRLAELQDVNRVALEAGNSPQMIFRHYRELATPEQARTWFAITPETAPNVVPMTLPRAKR
jgi:integrase